METQCQNLKVIQRNKLLKLLHKFKELFNGTIGTYKTDPVYFELRNNTKPIFSRPYPVLKLHMEIFKK